MSTATSTSSETTRLDGSSRSSRDAAVRSTLPNTVFLPVVLAGVVATCFVIGWGIRYNPVEFMDLSVYRLGVQAWLDGHDIYGRLPATVFGNHLPFIYPPFAAVPFVPIAWVSWVAAWWSWTLLSLAALVSVMYLVARRVWPERGARGATAAVAVLLPAMLTLQPITDSFWFGQVNVFLMALVVADLLVDNPRWPRGLLIGIAAAIKLTPAGFVLLLLLRKDFRAAITAGISAVAATAIGFAVNWSGSTRFWLGETGLSRTADTAVADNQTIKAALMRLNLPDPLGTLLWVVLGVAVAGMAIAAIRRVLRSDSIDAQPLAMVLTAALLLTVSPAAWGHHWVWVVPALIVMLGRASRSVGWAVASAAVVIAFWIRPFGPKPLPKLPVFWWRPFDSPPQRPAADHHMHWEMPQHFYGNTYVLLTLVLLIAFTVFNGGVRLGRRSYASLPPSSPTLATKFTLRRGR